MDRKGALGGAVAIALAAFAVTTAFVMMVQHTSSQRMYKTIRFTQTKSLRSKIVFDQNENLMNDSVWLGTHWGIWNHTTNDTLWKEDNLPSWPSQRRKAEENIKNKIHNYLDLLNTTHNGFSKKISSTEVNVSANMSNTSVNMSSHLAVTPSVMNMKVEDDLRLERGYDIPYGELFNNSRKILEVIGNCTPRKMNCTIAGDGCAECPQNSTWRKKCEEEYEETLRKLVTSISAVFSDIPLRFQADSFVEKLNYTASIDSCTPVGEICSKETMPTSGVRCSEYCEKISEIYDDHKCNETDPSNEYDYTPYLSKGNLTCDSDVKYWCKCLSPARQNYKKGNITVNWTTLQTRIWDEETQILTDKGYKYMQLNRTFNVTMKPPEKCSMLTLKLEKPMNRTYYEFNIPVKGRTDEKANITYGFDGSVSETACNNCTNFSTSYYLPSEDEHNITVVAVDYDNKTDNMTRVKEFTIGDVIDITLSMDLPGDDDDGAEDGIIEKPSVPASVEVEAKADNEKARYIRCKFDDNNFKDLCSDCSPGSRKSKWSSDLNLGRHIVSVLAVDKNNDDDRDGVTKRFRLDEEITLNIDNPGSGEIIEDPNGDVKVNGTTNEYANISYKLDGGSWQGERDKRKRFEYTLTGLSDREHTVKVRAVDWNHGIDNVTKSRTFTTDPTRLSMTVDQPKDSLSTCKNYAPVKIWTNEKANISYGIDDPSKPKGCKGCGYNNILQDKVYPGGGSHIINVTAVDWNNPDESKDEGRVFNINRNPNAPERVSPGDGSTDVSIPPKLKVKVTDPDSGSYSLNVTFYNAADDTQIGSSLNKDSGDTASVTWSGLSGDTRYKWYAKVCDGCGLCNTSDTWSFNTTILNSPPTFANPWPNGTTVSSDPALRVSVSDDDNDDMNVTFYELGGSKIGNTQTGIPDGGTASVTWTGLSHGATPNWYAVADDGSATNNSGTWSFTVDAAAPSTSNGDAIDNNDGDDIVGNGQSMTLEVTSTDPFSSVSSVDATIFGKTYSLTDGDNDDVWNLSVTVPAGLGDGQKDMNITATDTEGNSQTVTYMNVIEVDNTGPPVTNAQIVDNQNGNGVLNSGDSYTIQTDVSDSSNIDSVTTTALDGDSVTLTDGNGDGTYDAMLSLDSGVSDGSYSKTIDATDVVGNTGSGATDTIEVDNTPPTINYNPETTDAGSHARSWVYIDVSVSDANLDTVEETFNGTVSNLADGNYFENHTGLSDGSHTFSVTATDGEQSNSTAERTVTLDSTPPTGSIDPISDGSLPDTISGSASDSGSGVSSVDIEIHDTSDGDYWTESGWGSQTWLDCPGTTSWSYTGIDSGDWDDGHDITVTMRDYDNAGNVNSSADTESFTTNSPPDAPDSPSPSDGGTIDYAPTLQVNVSDPNGDTMEVCFYNATDDSEIECESGVNSDTTASVTWSKSEGTHEWYAVANDSKDTTQSSTWSFTVETPPEGNIDPISDDSTPSMISGNASDPDGVAEVQIKIHDMNAGEYWTDPGWGSKTWLGCSGTTSWNYTGIDPGDWKDENYILITLMTRDSGNRRDWSADSEHFTP